MYCPCLIRCRLARGTCNNTLHEVAGTIVPSTSPPTKTDVSRVPTCSTRPSTLARCCIDASRPDRPPLSRQSHKPKAIEHANRRKGLSAIAQNRHSAQASTKRGSTKAGGHSISPTAPHAVPSVAKARKGRYFTHHRSYVVKLRDTETVTVENLIPR